MLLEEMALLLSSPLSFLLSPLSSLLSPLTSHHSPLIRLTTYPPHCLPLIHITAYHSFTPPLTSPHLPTRSPLFHAAPIVQRGRYHSLRLLDHIYILLPPFLNHLLHIKPTANPRFTSLTLSLLRQLSDIHHYHHCNVGH